jgi:hypothetical protein
VGGAWPVTTCYLCIPDDDRGPVENFTGVQHKVLRRFKGGGKVDVVDTVVRAGSACGRLMVMSFQASAMGAVASGAEDPTSRGRTNSSPTPTEFGGFRLA